VKVDGDFTVAFLRAMPHQVDSARMVRVIQALKDTKVVTLCEFANNRLEVMKFVFNTLSMLFLRAAAPGTGERPGGLARLLRL
jgi:hypothetical protein